MSRQKAVMMWQMARSTKDGSLPSSEVITQYLEHFDKLPDESQDDHAAFLKAKDLLRSGHVTASLNYATDKLEEFAEDPPYIHFYRKHVDEVMNLLIEMTSNGTNNPEFISTYERILELGESSFELHFCAIHNYADQGRKVHALKLAKKLEKVVPNYPGLKDTISDLEITTAKIN